MPPKAKRTQEGSNERTDTFYGTRLARGKDVLEWPYKTPSAEFMGKSGFYFTPTKKFTDRVTCFYCKKTQSNWNDVKDPTKHHLQLNPDCPFSKLLHLARERSTNPDFDWSNVDTFNNPLSKEATELRQETFGKSWPHDRLAKSSATSKNMVNAGFYYSPLDAGDDLAICVYCGVSLEGWEEDDDPLFEHQKRSKDCYFLKYLEKGDTSRNSIKRSLVPMENLNEVDEDDAHEENAHSQNLSHSHEESEVINHRSLRPQRKRQVVQELSSEDAVVEDDDDESFGITANNEELDDEEYLDGSNHKISKVISTSMKKSSQSKSTVSPFKKSKFLDSSFDNDMFSVNKTQNLEIPPVSKLLSPSPEKLSKSKPNLESSLPLIGKPSQDKKPTPSPLRASSKPALSDITNISRKSSKSPKQKKLSEVLYPESDEENSIILISNSKENIDQDSSSRIKEESMQSALEEPKEISLYEDNKEDGDLEGDKNERNQTENILPDLTKRNDISQKEIDLVQDQEERGRPTTTERFEKLAKDSSHHIESPSKAANKSILQSISRFFQSPKLHRSQSPFLDSHYRGSDQIEPPIIGTNDTPIEESTDHHIVIDKEEEPAAPLEDDKQSILKDLDEAEPLHGSDDELQSSNYQSIDDANYTKDGDNYWMPTDTNKLFEKLEPLETAKNYLKELKDLDYELNDDVDGRISYFINEMPANELEMTISEWIIHSAEQGKKHLTETCETMLKQFDEECERAIRKLKELPTE